MSLGKRVLKYLLPYKKRLSAGIVSMLIHSFLTVYFVRVFQHLIETVISDIAQGQEGIRQLTIIALMMVIVYFLKGIVYYGQRYLISHVSYKAVRDIRNDLYANLQSLSLNFYSQNKTGEIISRVTNDVNKLQKAIVDSTVSVIYKFLTLLGGIGYLFYLNFRLTLFLIVMLPVMTYVLKRFNTKIRRVSRDVQTKIADVSDVLQETLSAIRVVKSFGREEYEYERFSSENEANFRAKKKNAQYSAILTPSIEFLSSLSFTAILWYGGYEVMQGAMKPSELIAFFTMLLTISSPLKSLTGISATIQKALASAERIFEIIDMDNHISEENENNIVLDQLEGNIKFDNVSFAYKEGEKVLSNINLEAKPGEIVALVGPSGAGKTTLVDLIPRFYDPTAGKLLIDGYDIRDLDVDVLREQIGVVPQETILFSGSLANNIAYGDLNASLEDIQGAARAANAHGFIQGFKDGYDTAVGERGVGLSGGQRQRIAIARAILKDPKILILDEATSALDAESEALVQDALNALMENRTTFVIAHRLTTIKNADRIAVLSEGCIKNIGTHKELIEKGDLYYELYEGQFKEI